MLHCTNLYSFWWYVHDSVRNTKEIIDVNLTRWCVRKRDKRRFTQRIPFQCNPVHICLFIELGSATINPFLLLIPFARLFFFFLIHQILLIYSAPFLSLSGEMIFFWVCIVCDRLPFFPIIITIFFTHKCIIYDFYLSNHFFRHVSQSNGIQTDEWLMKTPNWNQLIATSFSLHIFLSILRHSIHFQIYKNQNYQ